MVGGVEGTLVGVLEGMSVGLCVGRWLGWALGSAERDGELLMEGRSEGAMEGCADGVQVSSLFLLAIFSHFFLEASGSLLFFLSCANAVSNWRQLYMDSWVSRRVPLFLRIAEAS